MTHLRFKTVNSNLGQDLNIQRANSPCVEEASRFLCCQLFRNWHGDDDLRNAINERDR